MKLRPFWKPQRQGFRYATHRNRDGSMRQRIGLFMEQRLGKTPVMIRRFKLEAGRKLVVGFASNCHDLLAELNLEVPAHSVCSLLGKSRPEIERELRNPRYEWYVINYERLRGKAYRDILLYQWSCIALDESTAIRNPKSQITKLMNSHTRHIPVRCVMSGLPHPESIHDFFSQMTFLFGTFMGCRNYWEWRNRYFEQGTSWSGTKLRWLWVPKPGVLEEIKRHVHRRCFMLTRKQAGMGEVILHKTLHVQLPPALQKLYRLAERDWELSSTEMTKYRVVVDNWLAQIAGGCHLPPERRSLHKVKELFRYINEEVPNDKVVVWFRFNAEIAVADDFLRKRGVKCQAITGKTPPATRHAIRAAFNTPRLRVLLVQGKCGRFGWNLSAADIAAYYSRHYDGEVNAQTADRIVHFQKRRPYLYVDLVCDGTIDETVVECVNGKVFDARRFQSRLLSRLRDAGARMGRT